MSRKLLAAGGLALALGLTACGGGNGAPALRVTQVAQGGAAYQHPLDAVPANDGAVYFTADGPDGPGVFVARSGSEARPVATGRPFRAPVGITLSADQSTVFVADAQADAVFTLPVGGGAPKVLPGSPGLAPRGVEIKGDQLFLTGADPQSAKPAVLSIPAAGGAAKVLATGLSLPDAVAVGDDGTVFVTDRFTGMVQRIADGRATPLAGVAGATLGDPAGLAFSPDGRGLMVSSLDPKAETAQVILVDVASGTTSVFDHMIRANHSAGGLHKAAGAAVYGWADTRGRVYRIEP